jgi:uncharacterized protein (DUF305 family)
MARARIGLKRSLAGILAATLILSASAAMAGGPGPAFHRLMETAMENMIEAMHRPPSGDVDRDFSLAMIPHHQGAIDMAIAELRYGADPQLQRIAREIVVEQQQEIVVMRAALCASARTSGTGPTRPSSGSC